MKRNAAFDLVCEPSAPACWHAWFISLMMYLVAVPASTVDDVPELMGRLNGLMSVYA